MNDKVPQIPFRKMNGLGNDFVVLDARARDIAVNDDAAREICDRDAGIGCDQLIVIEPVDGADAFMRIYNQDGGEVSACGNAARCVGDILMTESGRTQASIETLAGSLTCDRVNDDTISVDMGVPRFDWRDIPLAEPFHDTRTIELQIGPIDDPVLHSPSVVNVGNPHCIFWVDDIAAHDLGRFGPMLENHLLFPERANISLARITSRETIALRVWERGAGLTKACGTAACAAAVAAARKDLTGRNVTVSLPGGELDIVWREEDDHIIMSGPVEYEFDGQLPAALLQPEPVS